MKIKYSDRLKNAVKHWEQSKKKPAFIREMAQLPKREQSESYCKNCAGMGVHYVTFTNGGAFQSPPSGNAPTLYWDGKDKSQWREGWYSVDNSEAYECPTCQKYERATIDMDTGEVLR